MKIIAGIVAGFIMAVIGAILVTTSVAGAPNLFFAGPIAFFVFWVVGVVVAVLAKSASKAWRRLLITSAILCFLLPLSAFVFTGTLIGTVAPSAGENSAAATAGMAIGGSLVAGVFGFIGFFLGVVFLIIGLLVGREKQVIYVQAPPTTPQHK